MNKSRLFELISRKITFSESEKSILESSFTEQHSIKGQHLIRRGDRTLNLYFINNGFARIYSFDGEGNEVTTSIAGPGEFITSFDGFIHNKISSEFVQCLTECELLFTTSTTYSHLYQSVREWSLFCKTVYESYILKSGERIRALQIKSASERYEFLLDNNPELVLNIPIKILSSYLGIKPQSLSRIRKSIK